MYYILFFTTFVSSLLANTFHVPADYLTIQDAINNSTLGDTIFISSGNYQENIDFFDKNISIIGESKETTIIDGNMNGKTLSINYSNQVYIKNLSINNGQYNRGAGLFIQNSNVFLNDCIVNGNYATGDIAGGGMYAIYSNVYIDNCVFKNNFGRKGGGIASVGSNFNIINSIFTNNSDSELGGVLLLDANSNVNIEFSVINNNSSAFYVGSNSSLSSLNCTIVNNGQQSVGGEIVLSYNSEVDINNTIIFSENENYISTYINYAWDNSYPCFISISNSLLPSDTENIATVHEQDLINTYNVIVANPQFTDLENGDFTLQSTSPCIDSGDPNSLLDPDGTTADMGAYYFDQNETPIGCTDSYAENYISDAIWDDGSCQYPDNGDFNLSFDGIDDKVI